MTAIDAAKRHIESLSDEDLLQEFARTWTDRTQVANAIRKMMLDTLAGDDTAVAALGTIARECGVPSWYAPDQTIAAVVALRKRVDALTTQLETTPVLTMADRSKLASLQVIEDRSRNYAKVVAERDALLEEIARVREPAEHIAAPQGSRPHRLTWSGTEWVAPCGCRYHPDDDNGSHGGAPHVHRCEKHEKAPNGTAPKCPLCAARMTVCWGCRTCGETTVDDDTAPERDEEPATTPSPRFGASRGSVTHEAPDAWEPEDDGTDGEPDCRVAGDGQHDPGLSPGTATGVACTKCGDALSADHPMPLSAAPLTVPGEPDDESWTTLLLGLQKLGWHTKDERGRTYSSLDEMYAGIPQDETHELAEDVDKVIGKPAAPPTVPGEPPLDGACDERARGEVRRKWAAGESVPKSGVRHHGTRSDGKWGCDACCNGDRCDDATHVDRRKCGVCKGSGAIPPEHLAAPPTPPRAPVDEAAVRAERERVAVLCSALDQIIDAVTKACDWADGTRVANAIDAAEALLTSLRTPAPTPEEHPDPDHPNRFGDG